MPATAPDLVPASTPTFTDHARITNHWMPLSIHREAAPVGGSGSGLRIVQTVPGSSEAFQADDGAVFQLGRDARRADGADHRGASSLTPGPVERELRVAMSAVPRDGVTLATTGQRVTDENARLSVAAGTFNRVLVLHTPASADHGNEVRHDARGVGFSEAQTTGGALELGNLR